MEVQVEITSYYIMKFKTIIAFVHQLKSFIDIYGALNELDRLMVRLWVNATVMGSLTDPSGAKTIIIFIAILTGMFQ